MGKYALIAPIFIILALLFIGGIFISKERRADELTLLREENAVLKSQLRNIESVSPAPSLANAKVLSTYPLNVKNRITLNLGGYDGVKKGAVVTLQGRVLVGSVVDVFARTSTAKTVYDHKWQTPVRIGEEKIDGLLVGGAEPRVTLIQITKPVAPGDRIYSASKDIPYGIEIGVVRNTREDAGGAFKTASIDLGFNINDLRTVSIINIE